MKGKVYEIEPGLWGFRVRIAGKDVRKRFPNKKQAEEGLRDIVEAARAKQTAQKYGIPIAEHREARTLKGAFNDFLAQRKDLKPSTLRLYRVICSKYLLKHFGDVRLNEITEVSLKKFVASLRAGTGTDKPKKPTTIKAIMRPLQTILSQAIRTGEITINPMAAIKLPGGGIRPVDPFTSAELDRVLGAVDNRYRCFFTLWAYTGARPSELAALRWKHIAEVDGRKVVRIERGFSRGVDGEVEGDPKSANSVREIPLLAEAEGALLAHRAGAKALDINGEDYIFRAKDGTVLHYDNAAPIWERACRRAGVRYRAPYQLRHTFITRCIESRAFPINHIARWAGNTTAVVLKHYAGFIEGNQAEYHRKLSEVFASGQKSGDDSIRAAQTPAGLAIGA
jgi:integrase